MAFHNSFTRVFKMSRSKFFFVIMMAFLLVCFVMNKSIGAYLQQRYHIEFTLNSEILDEANGFKVKLEQIRTVLMNDEFEVNYELLKNLENNKSLPQSTPPPKPQFYDDEYSIYRPVPPPPSPQKLDLKEDEEFLLIGDSMMQGVALALSKDLKKRGIKSTNLSKQNTGLAYKSYFDWAKAVQLSLAGNEKLKYLVVLLGANDPWDIPVKGKFYAFNTEEWKEIYAQRVDEILQIAKEYGTKVLWYEIPPVKRQTLNAKIQVINDIFKEESDKNSEIFIQTAQALSGGAEYSSYIRDENNKSIKVRADDGVHFNIKGAKIMSELLLQHFEGGAL